MSTSGWRRFRAEDFDAEILVPRIGGTDERWLFDIGDEILPNDMGIIKNNVLRIPFLTNQYFMESKASRVFSVANLWDLRCNAYVEVWIPRVDP